jgi:hypothetical protein
MMRHSSLNIVALVFLILGTSAGAQNRDQAEKFRQAQERTKLEYTQKHEELDQLLKSATHFSGQMDV